MPEPADGSPPVPHRIPVGVLGAGRMGWPRWAATAGIALPQAGVNREICRSLKPRRYQLSGYGI